MSRVKNPNHRTGKPMPLRQRARISNWILALGGFSSLAFVAFKSPPENPDVFRGASNAAPEVTVTNTTPPSSLPDGVVWIPPRGI